MQELLYRWKLSEEDTTVLYGVLGGIPRYLNMVNSSLSVKGNLYELFFAPRALLSGEVDTLLNDGFKETSRYSDVLSAIASGKSSLNDIAEAVRMQTEVVTFYLNGLIRVCIIKKEVPYGSKNNKKSIYKIIDGLFRCHYQFLRPNMNGMRNGEIRALRCDDIEQGYRSGYDRITISRSLAPYTGVKSTKGKYDRTVLIPHDFGDRLIRDSRNGIVISQDGEYMSSLTLRLSFYNVLFALGISEEARCERRLTFHSLRHYFSTYTCQENISQEDRMVVLGHRSEKVNDRYTHISDARLEKVAEVMGKLYRAK